MPDETHSYVPKNVLTINFGGIGDEVLFLPTLATIKQLLPESKLTLLVEPRSRSIEQVTDLIDEIITFDIKKQPLTPFDMASLLMLIRKGRYDLVISSGSSPMVAMLLYLSGIPIRVGYYTSKLFKRLLTHPVKLKRNQYAADMYHDLTRGLANFLRLKANARVQIGSDTITKSTPRVTLKAASQADMREMLKEEHARLDDRRNEAGIKDDRPIKTVLIHPGTSRMAVSKGIIKHWPSKCWLQLIERLSEQRDLPVQTRVILAGGPDDKEVIQDLLKELSMRVSTPERNNDNRTSESHSTATITTGGAPLNLIDANGKTKSLADLAALIDLVDVMVCVDSAPMHVGVGLDKPMVALFGPTDPQKLIPDQPHFKVLADRPADEPARHFTDGLGVRLLPDSVYQSLQDLLKAD
jgi:ADP-heptose:LPS heptosyltransferase